MDVHINMGQMGGATVQSESQNRIDQARQMILSAQETLNRLDVNSAQESRLDVNFARTHFL